MSNSPPLEVNLVSEHHFVAKIMCAYDRKALIFLIGCEMMDSDKLILENKALAVKFILPLGIV